MAQMILTKDWAALDVTKGTIQNVSAQLNVEVSEDNTASSGQVIYPKGAMTFDGVQLYARAVTDSTVARAEVRVSPFVEAGGGSGGGGGSVTPYILPTASATLKGGVKVGTTLTIDGTGVLNAKPPTPYNLPPATVSTLGGIKVGNNLTIDTEGVLNAAATPYTLPTASATEKGGAKVGAGLKMTGEILSADTGTAVGQIVKVGLDGKIDSAVVPAVAVGNTFVESTEAAMLSLSAKVGDICVRTDESKSYILQKLPVSTLANWVFLQSPTAAVQSVNGKTGAVTLTIPEKVSELENDANYIATLPTASTTEAGVVKVGSGLSIDSNGALNISDAMPTASTTQKGGIKVGEGLEMDGEALKVKPIAKATTTTVGGIIVGENLTIDADGKLSANAGGYTLPIAEAGVLGGVKVGQRLSIDPDTGVLTADDQTTGLATVAKTGKYSDLVDAPSEYTLPTASDTIKGGVKVGAGLTIADEALAVDNATATTAGIAKLYTTTGTSTDGAMTQKAVGDNYYPLTGGTLKGNTINRDVSDNHLVLCGGKNNNDGGAVLLFGKNSEDTRKGGFIVRAHSDAAEWNLSGDTAGNLTWGGKKIAVAGDYLPTTGGTMTGAIESKNIALQNTTSNYLRIQQSATLQQGAVLDFYGRDDTHGGRVVIACGTPDGSSYKSLVVSGNGSLTFDNKNVAVGDFLPLSGGKMSGDIAKDVNTKVLTLSGSVDGGHGARLDLVGEDYTVDANVQGCFGLHSIKAGKDHALIGYPDGRLTWDGNSLAIGAIKRLTPTEVVSYADSGGHNINDTWVKAVFEAMPAGATWLAYNSANEEWSYIFSKSQSGTYGNIQRNSHMGKIQVKGVSTGGVYTKWKEVTLTEMSF